VSLIVFHTFLMLAAGIHCAEGQCETLSDSRITAPVIIVIVGNRICYMLHTPKDCTSENSLKTFSHFQESPRSDNF